jgi:phosphatidate cytidylyltransferase
MAADYAGRLRRQALGPRIATALIGIPLLLVLLWLGGPWWILLAAGMVVLAALEFTALRALRRPAELTLTIAALFAFTLVATAPGAPVRWIVPLWALVLVALGLTPLLRTGLSPQETAPSPAASVLLGIAYLATPLGVLGRWRLELTPLSVLAFLLVIWANDIAAYFVGLAVGRHKLAPRVSPGKSWEGAIGGLAGGLAAGVLLAGWLSLGRGQAAVWAAAVTLVSQAGDLFESALKRRAGMKDSGRLLPGHGGVLDRFDGVLLAAPVAYLLLRAFAGR